MSLVAGFAPITYALVEQNQGTPPEFVADSPADPISQLAEKMKAGKVKLTFERGQGYLNSLLKELDVSPTSQTLVFSKTSLQAAYISPSNPRAVYFNDSVYVAWIPGAPKIEMIALDPQSGPIFYTLQNRESTEATMDRHTNECFQCHTTTFTANLPGLMARSVFAGPDGSVRLTGGSKMTTAESLIKERWGGWYVSGDTGNQRHMGNEVAKGDEQAPTIDMEKGANVTDLSRYFDVGDYRTPHSDVVALMVVEQQMHVQNLIVKAGYLSRKAISEAPGLLKFGFSAEHVQEGIHDRIQNACEPLVQALLCVKEPKFEDPMKGDSGFSEHFSKSSPADKLGRRLSELDLKTRLLRYPCSPMIYSKLFGGLPSETKRQVFSRLKAVLSGEDKSKPFDVISAEDSKAILEILGDTLPEFSKDL